MMAAGCPISAARYYVNRRLFQIGVCRTPPEQHGASRRRRTVVLQATAAANRPVAAAPTGRHGLRAASVDDTADKRYPASLIDGLERMDWSAVKALTFDTGGTILDWHSGFRDALASRAARYGIERDWPAIANELRRRSLQAMLNLGEHKAPEYNFDDAHRSTLDAILDEHNLTRLDEQDRHYIAWHTPHHFKCWDDFPAVLPVLKQQRLCVSFTILSYRLIIDTARHNQLHWDAVFSCEGIGKYKLLPEAYRAAARYLQLDPAECCMVACHPFDLDAAKAVGFRTALVRRQHEWGPHAPYASSPIADDAYDIVVDDFPALAKKLNYSISPE